MWGEKKSKHLSRQLTGHTTIGSRVKLHMRIYSTIFKLSSRQQSFTLRRLWWLGQALCCGHLSSQLFIVMRRDFGLSHYLEKCTLQTYKPVKKCRNHCSTYYGSSLGRTLYKSRCWGQEKLNQILKKHCPLHWLRRGKSPIPSSKTTAERTASEHVWKETNTFLLQIGAKPKALENLELPPCFQINLPLLNVYCC